MAKDPLCPSRRRQCGTEDPAHCTGYRDSWINTKSAEKDYVCFVELWVHKCIDGTLNESKPNWKSHKHFFWLEDGMEKNRTERQNAESVSLFAFIFMALASVFVQDHERIPHRVSEQSVPWAKENNMTHQYSVFYSFYYLILPRRQSSWRAMWIPTHPSCKPPWDNLSLQAASLRGKETMKV